MINIILCDASLDGIQYSKELLRRCPSVNVVATSHTNTHLLQLLDKKIEATLIILDISLPFTNSLTLIKHIKQHHTAYKILLFTLEDDFDVIKLAITFGADGFLYKNDIVPSFMEKAITQICEVGYYTNVIVSKEMFDEAKQQKLILPETGLYSISKKEEEVFKLLQTGKTYKEIGKLLALQTRTVEWHLENIYRKLGVTTRAGAIEIGSFKNYSMQIFK